MCSKGKKVTNLPMGKITTAEEFNHMRDSNLWNRVTFNGAPDGQPSLDKRTGVDRIEHAARLVAGFTAPALRAIRD